MHNWRKEGLPKGDNQAYIDQKSTKKAVRRQIRREHAEDRRRFTTNLWTPQTPHPSFIN